MKKILIWLLAFLITAVAAVYQRMTGPTYPLRGKVSVDSTEVSFRLPRSHVTGTDCEIKIALDAQDIQGKILYKRFKSGDSWSEITMIQGEDAIIGSLPSQPPAGKLAYRVILSRNSQEQSLSGDEPVVIRFKGNVPALILIPHVIIMFLAMLFSTRAGIEALNPKSNPRKLAIWTTGFLVVGGLILGPLVQHFAFGALWTGFPFGTDLTDNKTLIALIAWILALIMGRKGKPARGWVLGASVVLMAVYLIPHSLFGSELDYSKINLP